jgi:hypothetical protein
LLFCRIAILVLLLAFPGCKDQRTKQLISKNGAIEVTVPRSWSIDPVLHHSAELQASNRFEGLYLIILSENKKDVPNLTLADHSQITREALLQKIHLIKSSEPEKIMIGSRPAIQVEFTANAYGFDLEYLHTSVETNTRFHQIICWAPAKGFEDTKSILQKIVFSFRERKT